MNWLLYALAAAAGMSNPVQTGANAQLKSSLQVPVWTILWVYLSGLCAILVLQLCVQESFPAALKLKAVPWWAWTGGLISIASTLAGLSFAQKMGSGAFTGISVTASIVTSILLDHFGLIGFKPHAASPLRILGGVLMIVGLWLVARF